MTSTAASPLSPLVSTALSNARANDELQERAREQSALREVAGIAAAGADPVEVFAAVVRSASSVLDGRLTTLIRFVDDDVADVLASSGPGIPPTGKRIVIDPVSVTAQVRRTGRPARIDDYRGTPRQPPRRRDHRAAGVGRRPGDGGQLWGMLAASSVAGPLPVDVEDRLSQFAETVATAIAGAQARAELRALAHEQAALRRVAELIARGGERSAIYAAVTSAAADIVHETAALIRCDESGSATVVASSGGTASGGSRVDPAPDDDLVAQILRTRLPHRVERFSERDDHPDEDHLRGLTPSVGVPIIVGDRLWGVLSAAATSRRLLTTTEQSLQQFAGLMAAAVANAEARGRLQDFADQQAALRRVAELAAHDAPADEVLQAVAVEASGLAGVAFGMVLQYEGHDGSTLIVGLDGASDTFAVGLRTGPGDGSAQRVWSTGRPALVDDLGAVAGLWPRLAHERGFTCSAGVPIVIHGALWGAVIVVSDGDSIPRSIEEHLANFADLRRPGRNRRVGRRCAPRIAVAGQRAGSGATGGRTGRPRCDAGADLLRRRRRDLRDPGPADVRAALRPRRRRRGAGGDPEGAVRNREVAVLVVPVTVEGRAWGALTVVVPTTPMPPGIEQRLTPFAELTAVAIANADNKSKLTASRARVIATADETRRRVQRDVHDGAQQRLVHTIIVLKMARDAAMSGGSPADLLDEALTNAKRASKELREIVRGILPASLTRGGLRSGLESLLSDLALPVDLAVTAPRMSPPHRDHGLLNLNPQI